MVQYTILLEEQTARLYARVAEQAERSVETVLADALFKLAGELALEALAVSE